MRSTSIILSLFIPLSLHAQKDNSCPPVEVFVKGYPYQQKFERSFFTTDFKLALSDSSYKIISFQLTWDRDGSLYTRVATGDTVKIKHASNSTYDLVLDTIGIVTMDNVKILKGKDTCRARGLALTVTSRAKVDEEKEFIPCAARFPGYGRDPVVYARVFLKDFSLELSDPSYTITGFDITNEDFETLELFVASIKGNHVSITKPDVIRVLSRVRPGSVVVCENITATKNGKTYKVRPLSLYVK